MGGLDKEIRLSSFWAAPLGKNRLSFSGTIFGNVLDSRAQLYQGKFTAALLNLGLKVPLWDPRMLQIERHHK